MNFFAQHAVLLGPNLAAYRATGHVHAPFAVLIVHLKLFLRCWAAQPVMIGERIQQVLSRIAAVSAECGRPPARLVAVSKTVPVPVLLSCYEQGGQRVFGENYVQEIMEKAPLLPQDIHWHFIGHLQTNKVQRLIDGVPNLWCVESVGSIKLASQLNTRWGNAQREHKLRVFIQVNTSAEESKDGAAPEQCRELVQHVLENCSNLVFCGLMTIGKLGDISSACFDLLAKLRKDILALELANCPKPAEFELSMGMSGDYELAIKSGSTNVRVGSTLFGARAPKQ